MIAATICPSDVPNCSGLLDVNLTLPVELTIFLVMVLILWRLVWRPIIDLLEKRDQRLAAGAHAAAEADRLYSDGLSQVQATLEAARGEARDMVAVAYRSANAAAESVRGAATREARAMTEAALVEIRAESDAAVAALRDRAAALAVAAAERLLHARLDGRRFADVAAQGADR